MTTQSKVKLRGYLESLPGGSKDIYPPDINNLIPPGVETQLVLTTGLNTVTVPAVNSVVGAIIVCDPSSATDKTIMGNAVDTGIRINPATWNFISFDPANIPTNIILSSSGNDSLVTSVIFV